MSQPGFDLILGTDTLKELGIVLHFRTKEIDIDDIIVPMRDITKLSTRAKLERAWMANNSDMIHEPKSTLEATQWVVKILDAKCEKAILHAVVNENCSHLSASTSNQKKFLKLLAEFEDRFDGTLSDWDTEPVSLKLREGVKPYHGRPFPTPKVHKETLKKGIERLWELGVLKWQPESEWASPPLIVPKQNQAV
jgi:hypothetical protein